MEIIYILYLFYIIVLCSGLYLNMFIAVVSYRTWLRHGLQLPRGLLLFCLGLSCATFEGYELFKIAASYIWPGAFIFFNLCAVFFECLSAFCIFLSMCQISWLCSFYCIKLVSFQHWIFKVLKSRLPSVLPRIIVGTLVASSMWLSLLFGVIAISVPVDNSNNSTYCRKIPITYFTTVAFILSTFNIMISLPFCLILVSLSCTVLSLIRHIWRVRGTLSLDRSHLEPYLRVVTTMTLLLALNTSFYASKFLKDSGVLPPAWGSICWVIYILFYPLQALILIFRTKKLNSCFIGCLYRRSLKEI